MIVFLSILLFNDINISFCFVKVKFIYLERWTEKLNCDNNFSQAKV